MNASAEALRRVVARTGTPGIVDTLAALPGADFTTLMLHVMRARAARITPATLVQQYERDRFVAGWGVPVRDLRAAEDVLFGALPPSFEVLGLSPVAPFGASSAIATVDQHKVVTTVRGSEVASDPTNVLALEAARRRHADPNGSAVVRFATSQRVVRAQPFSGPRSFAHFTVFGLLSAGRDRGNRAFEHAHLAEHIAFHIAGLRAAGAERVRVALTDFTGEWPAVVDALGREIDADEVVVDPDRPNGAGYYQGLCFKVHPTFAGETLELGDGGVVDWTRQLVGSRKERCVISGIGVDRLALVMRSPPPSGVAE
jgi:hypothetical protein